MKGGGDPSSKIKDLGSPKSRLGLPKSLREVTQYITYTVKRPDYRPLNNWSDSEV